MAPIHDTTHHYPDIDPQALILEQLSTIRLIVTIIIILIFVSTCLIIPYITTPNTYFVTQSKKGRGLGSFILTRVKAVNEGDEKCDILSISRNKMVDILNWYLKHEQQRLDAWLAKEAKETGGVGITRV
jgi:hypothetical protein